MKPLLSPQAKLYPFIWKWKRKALPEVQHFIVGTGLDSSDWALSPEWMHELLFRALLGVSASPWQLLEHQAPGMQCRYWDALPPCMWEGSQAPQYKQVFIIKDCNCPTLTKSLSLTNMPESGITGQTQLAGSVVWREECYTRVKKLRLKC